MEQTKTELLMQKELDYIAKIIDDRNKPFYDYCDYEDEVGRLIRKHCPAVQCAINNYGIGITIFMGDIRNYIRTKANVSFVTR